MQSSGAVFTRQNPFPPEPLLPKAHYSPSRAKTIPRQQKKLALSPVRFDQLISPPKSPPPRAASRVLEDQHFLEESNRAVLCPTPSVKEHGSFSESWPSTDLGPLPHSSGAPPHAQAPQPRHSVTTVSGGMEDPSVLSKYVERFRYGKPQSRKERQRSPTSGVDGQPLWWMTSSCSQLSNPTPTRTSAECFSGSLDSKSDGRDVHRPFGGQFQHSASLSPTGDLLDLSELDLSDSSPSEPGEPEILRLQAQTTRLLHKSEISLSCGSTVVPLSSAGVGCSDFSSSVSVDEPIRKPTVPNFMDSACLITAPSLPGGEPRPAPSTQNFQRSHTRPEDDILFQWRLRRKMEQDRQGSQAPSHSRLLQQYSPKMESSASFTYPPQSSNLSFTCAPMDMSGSVFIPAARPAPVPALSVSSSIVSKLSPETPTHSHHKPTTCSHSVPLSQPCKEVKDTRVSRDSCSLSQVCLSGQSRPSESSAGLCSKHHSTCPPPSQPSESTEREWRQCQQKGDTQDKDKSKTERGGKKVAPSNRKKKAERHVGDDNPVRGNQHTAKVNTWHSRGQDEVGRKTKESSREGRWQNGVQSSAEVGQSVDLPSPPSQIQNTLGQVVSEVLFPASDSPTLSRTSCFSTAPRSTPPAPPQSPAPPLQTVTQPYEVIDQLMQEAQDSDGLEFEDDPLLQVLRQQRKCVKQQLCEIDMLLNEA